LSSSLDPRLDLPAAKCRRLGGGTSKDVSVATSVSKESSGSSYVVAECPRL
jgi:hypothetical protein